MPTLSQQASSEPEGDHQQVVSEAGCSEFTGRVWSPEISIVVVREDRPERSGESRQCAMAGRQQSHPRYGQCVRHHRDLRPGHVNTGVAGELERSDCILLSKSGWVIPEHKTPGVSRLRIGLVGEPMGNTKQIDTGSQVLGNK